MNEISSKHVDLLPSVDVVIPCYNGEKWVGRAIESVLLQNYPKVQIVVVDDGSKDDSQKVISRYLPDVKSLRIENSGACVARNAGASYSSGDYVMFLDCDDYLEESFLINIGKVIPNTEPDLVIAASISEDENGSRHTRISYPTGMSNKEIALKWMEGNIVQTAGIIWNRAFFDRIGRWGEDILKGQDEEIFLRALCSSPKIATCEGSCVVWCHNGSTGRITARKGRREFDSLLKWNLDMIGRPHFQDEDLQKAFGARLYFQARTLFVAGHFDLGRVALKGARAAGFHGHAGGRMHRLLSTVLGLDMKERMRFILNESGINRQP